MSERYSRLFTLPENLYTAGSPVVIAAGTLLKDNQTGKIVAQLKLRSISNKVIKAVKVNLNLFDTAGKPIGNVVEYEYLDLDAHRDSEFGQKNPVITSEAKARSYEAAVSEVVFADRTTWAATDSKWEPLPKQKTLDAVLVHAELIKQYKITVGSNFSYYPMAEKDLWYCACGALNHESENCHTCLRSLFELQTIDLEQLAKDRDARLEQEAADAAAKVAAEKAAAEAAKKKTAKILKIAIPAVCAIIAVTLLTTKVIIPSSKYNNAVSLMDAGKYEEAIVAFEAMDGYKDSTAQIANCENAIISAAFDRAEELSANGDYDGAIAIYESFANYEGSADGIAQVNQAKLEVAYRAAEMLAQNGQSAKAAIAFARLGDYQNAKERCMEQWNATPGLETISVGYFHSVGLKADGTVLSAGYNENGQCDVANWSDIVAVSAGKDFTVGLKYDGTVVATGNNEYNQCHVYGWTDIIAISAGYSCTIGLKSDGTVVATGRNYDGECEVDSWKDIVAISSGSTANTIGLKSDGTVVAIGYNEFGQCNVSNWKNIKDVKFGGGYVVGLKEDGTLVAVGTDKDGRLDIESWTDIVEIEAEVSTWGRKADGTIVMTGLGYGNQSDATKWTNIIAISSRNGCILGLKPDGTVVSAGLNLSDQANVSSWKNIKIPN